jgi:hypothetical protein
VTVFDKSTRQDGAFSRDDFTYDHVGDVYSCPAGKMLTTTGSRVNDGATLRYRASKYDCEACRLKPPMLSKGGRVTQRFGIFMSDPHVSGRRPRRLSVEIRSPERRRRFIIRNFSCAAMRRALSGGSTAKPIEKKFEEAIEKTNLNRSGCS